MKNDDAQYPAQLPPCPTLDTYSTHGPTQI